MYKILWNGRFGVHWLKIKSHFKWGKIKSIGAKTGDSLCFHNAFFLSPFLIVWHHNCKDTFSILIGQCYVCLNNLFLASVWFCHLKYLHFTNGPTIQGIKVALTGKIFECNRMMFHKQKKRGWKESPNLSITQDTNIKAILNSKRHQLVPSFLDLLWKGISLIWI